jgi:CHAT domain-containing protein
LTKMNLRPRDAKALALYPSPKREEVMASLAAEIRDIVKNQSSAQPPLVRTRNVAPVVLPTPRGQRIKILFVSANPAGTPLLMLDEEAREIEAKIRAAEYRDSLELITKLAVRPDDLLQALNQHKPHVVHFSGHGSPTEEIILLDKLGKPKPVSKEALVSLFRALKDNIRVVLLNACFARPQAEAITGEIDCAIGMARAISDDAAITFAASFYRAIAFGRSVQSAFDQGIAALLLDGSSEGPTPILMGRKGIAADEVILINP